jgi:hypothetical protein
MINEVVFIILEVALVATFLAVFYFTYVKNVENNIVDQQIAYLIDDLTAMSQYVLTNEQRNKIKEKLDNMSIPDLSEDDKKVLDNNIALEKKATIYVGILLLIGFLAFIGYYIYSIKTGVYTNNFQDFNKAFMILLSVAITEYLFLNLIVKNYRSVKINYIKYKFLENLNNFSNK